jgi:hypothetical protein
MTSLSQVEDLLLPSFDLALANLHEEYEQKYIEINDEKSIHELVKRSEFPKMHIKQGTKKRTCQNMKGVLGGSNAFNFMSFVAGVITLVS